MQTKETHRIFSVTNQMLTKIDGLVNTASGKSILAKLRNSIGRPFSATTEVWALIIEHLPEEFLGCSHRMSHEERAILTALQLYAVHQQGLTQSVLVKNNSRFTNMGVALKALRKGDDRKSVDRRVNAMITATTFEELSYHLRHLIKLLKSKAAETKVDYAQLAEDLYWFSRGYDENIRLAWARAYYRQDYKGAKNNEK